jgi:choline dehydrogenase-like flavoprotein
LPGITGAPAADRNLVAALAAILPEAGPGPSATQAGVEGHLRQLVQDPNFASLADLWTRTAPLLDGLAGAFWTQGEERAAALLSACAAGQHGAPLAALAQSLVEFALEGYLAHPRHGGNRDGVVWKSLGLSQRLASLGTAHVHSTNDSHTPAEDPELALRRAWDVVVVGSGAGGSALAWRLATKGLSVLVLEKGPRLSPRMVLHDEVSEVRRNLLIPYTKDEPHVVVKGDRAERSRSGWTACCVGGGTVHYAAMLLRMHAVDFAGQGGAAPWPFGYATLRPYYDEVERLVGVAGADGQNPFEPPRAPFPLPPLATHPATVRVEALARGLGYHPYPTPRGILTRAYRGRGPCVYCPFCVNYACESDAKASAEATFLREAEATGRLTVLSGIRVVSLRVSARQRAEGVELVDAQGARRVVEARSVVLASGAVESARLALLSSSQGVGNRHAQVGRGLVFGGNAGLVGLFPYPGDVFARADDAAPFLNVALQDFCDGEPRLGTLVVERLPENPIHQALAIAEAKTPYLVGRPLKERLTRELGQSRSVVVESFLPMAAHPERRVTLDPSVTDRLGLPAARLTLARTARDEERARRVVDVARRLLSTAETVRDTWLEESMFLQAGTLRMGTDPRTSVVDPVGRFHDVANLYACDGSVLPSMGGVPPTLTILANALRIADHVT